ncbi:MAG: three-Cys-motif partner protein TcmP [Pyrinomonadaceae bacterium]
MPRKKVTQNEFLPLEFLESQNAAADTPEPKIKPITHPIWTENKAKLIERYLLYFVFITHHGTYIDGFAGPQEPDKPEMWAARLVLESEPRWLRHFHLFDINPDQIARLESLKAAQPTHDSKGGRINRDINIYPGDFNENVHNLLTSGSITQKEATFCLLDQWTTQCHWSSLQALANYKEAGNNKIELFYFLAVGWLGRTIAGTTQNKQKLRDWWGGDDWEQLRGVRKYKQADIIAQRFKKEFGYKSVKSWPIFERPEKGGKIMYYMIHATDHPEAPRLMARAYDRAVFTEPYEQLQMEFGTEPVRS